MSSLISSLLNSPDVTPERIRETIQTALSDDEATQILYTWRYWARAEQLPPEGKWFIWLAKAGRGWGKTRAGAEWILERERQGFKRMGAIAATAFEYQAVMINGESGLLASAPPWNKPVYEKTNRRVIWPSGAICTFYTADEPDSLRGAQHDTLWMDELAKWRYDREAFDMAMFGLRLGSDPRCMVTTTPRPSKLIRELIKRDDVVMTGGSSYDNFANVSEQWAKNLLTRYEGTRLGRQEIEAEVIDDVPGALWTYKGLDETRWPTAPKLSRVVVGVDPMSKRLEDDEDDGRETGIVVCAESQEQLDGRRHYFTLADHSRYGTPMEWAKEAVYAYHKWGADCLVAETNNGGDMVEQTIRNIDPNVNVRQVWASRGKYVRAEPIAALMEQNREHHVGTFAELEDELTTFVPSEPKSPNRLDAKVWALTELTQEPEIWKGWVPGE